MSAEDICDSGMVVAYICAEPALLSTLGAARLVGCKRPGSEATEMTQQAES